MYACPIGACPLGSTFFDELCLIITGFDRGQRVGQGTRKKVKGKKEKGEGRRALALVGRLKRALHY